MTFYQNPEASGGLTGTEDEIARLLDEIPLLYRAKAFAESINDPAYFSRLGEPLDEREQKLARAYLDGLGFPEADPASLADWSDAVAAAETLDRDPLALIASKIGDAARDAAEASAALDDVYDETVINAAAGGLVQAANGAALVILAEAEDDEPTHPFLARWRLYVRGRWPIGVAGATYNIL